MLIVLAVNEFSGLRDGFKWALTRLNLSYTQSSVTGINIIAGILAVYSLIFFYLRIENQNKQIKNQNKQIKNQIEQLKISKQQIDVQISQRIDERFTTAVNLLGSAESSARTGALYSLYHLAIDDNDKKYRKQIAQIMCAHIRSKTQEPEYQEAHKTRSSNEIQTCIDLLFGKESLYQRFAPDLDQADLTHSYLIGADFSRAHCQGADFSRAHCQGADFSHAHCQGADFSRAYCQGAKFSAAHCQGAYFAHAHCQGADFSATHCQGVNFFRTQCQGAYFSYARCQGAHFFRAQFQGAYTLSGSYELFGKSLPDTLGTNTSLETMITHGSLDDEAIQAITNATQYLDGYWSNRMQDIIKQHKDVSQGYTEPKDMITGILKDTPEIRAVINQDWATYEQLISSNK